MKNPILEVITIFQSKAAIEEQLQNSPAVSVVASLQIEDGWELILEGEPDDVAVLINHFGILENY